MADQRIAYTEEMVGSGHPTKADTLNRHALVEHNTDGTHKMTGGAAGVIYYHDGTKLTALAAGATTEVLVGGGAAAPVWTTATGTGAPVRATSPTLVTPILGTPASGALDNCTSNTEADNNSTTQLATTAFAKSQDAVLAREPDQGVAMTYAASGSTGIRVADNDNIDFGTGNFTLRWKGSIPDYTPSADVILMQKTDATNGWLLQVDTTGVLQLLRNAEAAKSSTAAPTITDGTVHEIVCVVTTETASVAGSVAFYVDGVALGSSVAITAGAPTTVNNAVSLYVAGTSAVRTASNNYAATTFNRALTAAEVLDLYRNGIAFADKWGSQTPVYTSNFSAGSDSWAAFRGTVDGNIDGIGGQNDTLRYYADTESDVHFIVRTLSPTDKYVRITADVYVPSTNTSLKQVFISADTIYSPHSGLTTTTDTWETLTAILIKTAPYVRIVAWGTGTVFFSGANSVTDDLFYVKNFTITELGATLALEPEGIQPAPGQWLDSSTNKLHAMQPAAGSSLTRRKKDFEVRWTNTWAGTHEAQYIGGVNQAVLPVGCYIEKIIGVITGATIEDIIVGDGSDTDRWVAATTGLAAGTTSFTIANAISDGTNYKLVVDPDANFTGSIAWTIKGIILQ